jgi:hypothetical protein
MAQATPVITIKQDFEPGDIPLVKWQQTYHGHSTEKMEVPVIEGRSIQATLYSLNEFNEAARELHFDTGTELFCYFCRILCGTIKDDWDNVIVENGFVGLVG